MAMGSVWTSVTLAHWPLGERVQHCYPSVTRRCLQTTDICSAFPPASEVTGKPQKAAEKVRKKLRGTGVTERPCSGLCTEQLLYLHAENFAQWMLGAKGKEEGTGLGANVHWHWEGPAWPTLGHRAQLCRAEARGRPEAGQAPLPLGSGLPNRKANLKPGTLPGNPFNP